MNSTGFDALEQKIGYVFADKSFLSRALTHSSYANEVNQRESGITRNKGGVRHNELYEFLGDAVLGFIIAEELFNRRPDDGEGSLSKKRASVVCEPALAKSAHELGIGGLIKLGGNMTGEPGRRQDSVLSDAMEAIFAAVYLDGGIDAARKVITHCLGKLLDDALSLKKPVDHKTRLQEYFFALDKNVKIEYSVTAEFGPAHRRLFTSQVAVNGRALGSGDGGTKKESEQNAAKEALSRI